MKHRFLLHATAVALALIGGPAALADQILVPAGSVWKYLDNGTDAGTAWREPAFSDASWAQGSAELGYGDADEATLVGFGGDTTNRHITTYFRKSFTISDPSAFSSLKLRLLRDDGAVVYLNGVEIRRDNMPAGTVASTTLASTAVADAAEDTYYDSTLPPTALVAGVNTLAVEVHQSAANSSDLSFNLELLGETSQALVPAGSVWKYLDDGSNQQSAWRQPGFSDALWKQGSAELGYGDGDEATVVGFGGSTTNRYVTTYFRKTFTVADPSAFLSLKLRLLRDDGAVVYLNGAEVRRDNMSTGNVSHTTLASTAVADAAETTYYDSPLSPSSLVAGTNTLAVEIHQSAANSSDISFNLELLGMNSVSVPRGPYLQLGTPTSVIVRWRTDVPTVGRVAFGSSSDTLTSVADEAAATTEHEVVLTGLEPNTRYYYSIGTPTATHLSGDDFTFRTMPLPGTVQPTRVWVLGDSGTADNNARAVANAYAAFTQNTPTDVWLMLGDNAYNNGTDAEYQAAVYNIYPSFLRQNVLWSTIGNHDTASSSNPALTIPYFQMFNLPTNGEAGGAASGTEKYYSFDHANIHFICLDSMTSSRATGGAMADWLRADLESTTQDWIIAFWHHPPYSKGSHDSDNSSEVQMIEMRTNILPILEAGGVDLVLAGHSHSYERSYLLNGHYGFSNTLTSAMILDAGDGREGDAGDGAYQKPAHNAANQGAVYVTAGSSGKISGGSLNHPAMFISLNNLGSMVIDVDGPRLDARFLRENGLTDDAFTLVKEVPNQPPTVTITAPVADAVFPAGAAIVVAAAAADPDGSIRQVDFYQGNTPLGSDTSEPFEFTWTGASAGTYQLTAAATDSLGATVTSSPVSIVVEEPLPPPPAAPANLTATAGNQSVSLLWLASPGAATYNVFRTDAADGIYARIASGLTSTAFNDSDLVNGTTYFYVVSAVNLGGESPVSNVATATPIVSAPNAPTGLTATASDSQVSLSWAASSNAESYTVLRSTTSGTGYEVRIDTLTATGYTDSSTVNGTTYYYIVTASNSAGTSDLSNEAAATPLPPAPDAPTSLTALASDSQVALTWTASTGAESYSVFRSITSGAGYELLLNNLTATSHTDSTAVNGTTYYYVVTASNSGGNSGLSNEATATPLPPAPDAPTGLTATAGNAQVSLNWTASAGAASYTVLRSTTTGTGYAVISTGLPVTSHTDSTAVNGTTYYYVVTASNSGGTSTSSNEASATPLPPAPDAPTSLTATAGNAQVSLNWTASAGAASYTVLRSTTNGTGYAVLSTGLPATSHTDSTAVNGTTYYYVVTASNSGGTSAISNQATATPTAPPAPPTAPTALSAAVVSKSQINLTWTDNSGNETGFKIERKQGTGKWTQIAVTGPNVTSFASTGLKANTVYAYRVRATSAAGDSAYSNQITATTPRR